ncbi:MAG: PA2779 family protein [Proteobacteria bacterium]|nr:PA2779 family protein [Pseudomonadota bacterium]
MTIQNMLKKLGLGIIAVAATLMVSLPGQAAMLGTAQIHSNLGGGLVFDQNTIVQERAWIRAQLQSHGVSDAEAGMRVISLSDNQVHRIRQKFDEMPAGAGAGGTILVIFLVFVATDLMGATDIFPFIRPLEK